MKKTENRKIVLLRAVYDLLNRRGKLKKTENRKIVLLRAAYDLLKRSKQQHYVQEATSILIQYDETNCDGHCLMEDIAMELNIENNTKPIPLMPEIGGENP